MIPITEALAIHSLLIEQYGGSAGVRDLGLLQSALNRPFQTFDGNPLYPQPEDKAAAIFESLINGHPFIDGNKRIAYAMLVLTLSEYGFDLKASGDDKYAFVMATAEGNFSYEEIRLWITKHLSVL